MHPQAHSGMISSTRHQHMMLLTTPKHALPSKSVPLTVLLCWQHPSPSLLLCAVMHTHPWSCVVVVRCACAGTPSQSSAQPNCTAEMYCALQYLLCEGLPLPSNESAICSESRNLETRSVLWLEVMANMVGGDGQTSHTCILRLLLQWVVSFARGLNVSSVNMAHS